MFIFTLSSNIYAEQNSIYDEGVKTLQEYLTINTTNPPGNEMETAKFLKKILDKEGIENQIFDLGNNRANLFAILKGDGSKKPVILLHHMDVVPADPKYWSVPPFSGKIVNGYIYGRGAVDIKGKGIIDLMTLINLKRMNVKLKRDIILLAVSDEEVDSTGTNWMIKNKPDLIKNADFLIDEGSGIIIDEKGNNKYYLVSIGDKSALWLKLTFTAPPGHGSIPMKDSSVNKALRAANKILERQQEFIILPDLKEYIKALLKEKDITKLSGYEKDLETSLKNKTFLEEISKDIEINACIKNTISITLMKGSDKINTIPNEASIGLDCRLLPGTDKDKFLEELKKIVNDNTMQIKIEEYTPPGYSPTDVDFMKALNICALKRDPDVKVIPHINVSSTDSSFYRAFGLKSYGFESYKLTYEEYSLAHSNDERISVKNIEFGINLLTDVLTELNK